MAKISGVLGARRVIPAEDQRAEIAKSVRQETGRVPLTPAQARLAEQDEWTGEDTPPGYTHHRVEVRTDREIAAQRRAETVGGSSEADSQTAAPRERAAGAVSVIRDFRAHLDRVRAVAEAARGTDRERETRAAQEIRKSMAVGQVIKEKLEEQL